MRWTRWGKNRKYEKEGKMKCRVLFWNITSLIGKNRDFWENWEIGT